MILSQIARTTINTESSVRTGQRKITAKDLH